MIIQQLFQNYPNIKNDFHKLIQHYQQIVLVQKAGGLRKELTPKICVIMHITYHYKINPLHASILADYVQHQWQQIQDIPWQYKPFIIPSS